MKQSKIRTYSFQGDNINHVEASDRHIVVFVVVWQHVTVYMNNTDLTFPQHAASWKSPTHRLTCCVGSATYIALMGQSSLRLFHVPFIFHPVTLFLWCVSAHLIYFTCRKMFIYPLLCVSLFFACCKVFLLGLLTHQWKYSRCGYYQLINVQLKGGLHVVSQEKWSPYTPYSGHSSKHDITGWMGTLWVTGDDLNIIIFFSCSSSISSLPVAATLQVAVWLVWMCLFSHLTHWTTFSHH